MLQLLWCFFADYLLGKGGYVFGRVVLSVCLFVCGQHYSNSYERIGMKFYGGLMVYMYKKSAYIFTCSFVLPSVQFDDPTYLPLIGPRNILQLIQSSIVTCAVWSNR